MLILSSADYSKNNFFKKKSFSNTKRVLNNLDQDHTLVCVCVCVCVWGGGGGRLCVWFLIWGVFLSVPFSSGIILLRKREMVALLLLLCGRLCSVSLPSGAMGWSAVCGSGISWSCSLFRHHCGPSITQCT